MYFSAFTFAGFGSVFTYMVALNTNIINFDKKHTGKIVGFLNAFFAGSPSIYSVLYYHLFTKGDSTEVSNQDFPGFMLFFAISFGVVDILCVFCVRFWTPTEITFVKFENDNNESSNKSDGNDVVEEKDVEIFCFARREEQHGFGVGNINGDGSVRHNDDLTQRNMSFKEILLNINFQLFMWMFAFASAIGLVYANNLTVISGSLHLDTYNDRLTLIIPITNAVVSASVGLISDLLKHKLPRMWIMIFASICFTVSQILVFFFASYLGWLVLSAIFVGTGIGVVWSLAPTIMRELFYVGNLGRNWGITILIAALIGIGAQESYGAFYDHYANGTGDLHCYGMRCVRGGSAVCIASGSLSIVIGFIMQFRRKCCPQ